MDVSTALTGSWDIDAHPADLSCVYADEAGTVFVATMIPVPAADVGRELRVARSTCTADVENVGGRPMAFQCYEVNAAADAKLISGSVVAKGRLWLVNIAAADNAVDRVDQHAMMKTLLVQALQYQ